MNTCTHKLRQHRAAPDPTGRPNRPIEIFVDLHCVLPDGHDPAIHPHRDAHNRTWS
jgi:hypothetical protein